MAESKTRKTIDKDEEQAAPVEETTSVSGDIDPTLPQDKHSAARAAGIPLAEDKPQFVPFDKANISIV